MATADIGPVGEDCVDVSVKGVVNGKTNYAIVNRAYEGIIKLGGGDELARLMQMFECG